jgi:glycosyltransferase involved in cell wall biosynthesis
MTRFALVHDWFDCVAGSEKVVREMMHCFPSSDVFSLVDHLTEEERKGLGIDTIETSFIQRLPFARKRFRHYLPLMPLAIEQFDLSSYDVILSSSHAVAKGVVTTAEQLHIAYVHTPIRYAWDMYHEYLQQSGASRGLKGALVKAALHYIRMWDRGTADRPDIYVANSRYVAARIKKTYGREAHVIYPPVDVHRWQTHYRKEPFFLAAGRLVPYKRFDLLVDAFAQLPDQRLVIIGDGPEYKKLKARAGANVEMLGYQNDDVLFDYMRRARAFVFAAVEDFGIMPVEAQACGTPVIGLRRGGVSETVIDGETGMLFDDQTPECVAETIRAFSDLPATYLDADHIRRNSERFSADRFRHEFTTLVKSAIRDRNAARTAASANFPNPRPINHSSLVDPAYG